MAGGRGAAAPGVPWGATGSSRRTTRPRWPASAICAVAVCTVLVLLLLVLNVLGIQLGRGRYDPDVGGTVADWFAGLATLVALPTAVLVGLRQVRAQADATALERERAAAEAEAERQRRADRDAMVADALELRLEVANVVDNPELATDEERASVTRWCDEVRQRGWVPLGAGEGSITGWTRDGRSASTADLLVTERTSLLPDPFALAVTCRNATGTTVVVERWTIDLDGRRDLVDAPEAVRRDEHLVRRLTDDDRVPIGFTTPERAAAAAATATVVMQARDVLGRSLRAEHRPTNPPEPADAR